MAETRKPDYFFTPDELVADENGQVVPGEVATAEDNQRDLDFEEAQTHWRPGDTLEW